MSDSTSSSLSTSEARREELPPAINTRGEKIPHLTEEFRRSDLYARMMEFVKQRYPKMNEQLVEHAIRYSLAFPDAWKKDNPDDEDVDDEEDEEEEVLNRDYDEVYLSCNSKQQDNEDDDDEDIDATTTQADVSSVPEIK
jgi:hypothetical protein